MKSKIYYLAVPLLATLAMFISIWGPETLAEYKDQGILDVPHTESVENAGEGYRYQMNSNEKLYLLSCCLSSQTVPETETSAMTNEADAEVAYQEMEGVYAFVVNRRGPSGREITDEQIYATCNEGLSLLKEKGILPAQVRDVDASSYDVTLYSAIDVLEPRNNVAVWKMSLSNSQKNADKANRLMDAYIDADDGKIYEFYVRTPLSWEEIDADALVAEWAAYMGLLEPSPYESNNPLLETTPYFRKYVFAGMGNGQTVVTLGFYEGINELFLKVSR
ncbi:MAG: hypothetical protein HFI56_00970 [Lachnospiraceae bacterium]|jgi:hypothetical protein|nr:hypothetical protein [Lachnospiraceae bacterium]MCI9396517.1 hypothetical protein [Lachnospiraceae bacterium]